MRDQLVVQTSRTATFSVFIQLRNVDPTYHHVVTRQLYVIVTFFSTFLKLSFTHTKKRDLLRLRDYFLGENADKHFEHTNFFDKAVKH